MTEYVDRLGKRISEGDWRNLVSIPLYVKVRKYLKKSDAPGKLVYAEVRWVGRVLMPYELTRSDMPTVICDDELSAVSQYEDFLVSRDCGAWYPSGGCLDRNGRQVSGILSFHTVNGERNELDPLNADLLESITENPEFGSW